MQDTSFPALQKEALRAKQETVLSRLEGKIARVRGTSEPVAMARTAREAASALSIWIVPQKKTVHRARTEIASALIEGKASMIQKVAIDPELAVEALPPR